jgi:hypothetical protein
LFFNLLDFELLFELLFSDLIPDEFLFGLELFDSLKFSIFALLKVKFNIFECLIIQLNILDTGGYQRLKVRDLNDWNPFADELFIEIVLMIHFGFGF